MTKANPWEERILLKPIGFVKTDAIGDEVRDKSRLSRIIIRDDLQKALSGIKDFSHLFVLFWLGEISSEDRMKLKVHPRGRKNLPLLGVFATRTNLRPNPVGLTLVELVKVEENVLIVRGLDAFDATAILDLKPYDPWDSVAEPRVPKWWKKLQEEKLKRITQRNNEE
jgi:tRNA-Thr(GGU) m(6)t(6)A37 methyltransferase TsaA